MRDEEKTLKEAEEVPSTANVALVAATDKEQRISVGDTTQTKTPQELRNKEREQESREQESR